MTGTFQGQIPLTTDASLPGDVSGVLGAFGYSGFGPGLIPYETGCVPTGASATFIRRDSNGALIIGIQSSSLPYNSSLMDARIADSCNHRDYSLAWYVPQKILVVRGETAYEFTWLAGNYEAYTEECLSSNGSTSTVGTMSVLRSAHYLLTAVVNRYGESIQVTYDSDDAGYTASWIQGGNATGISIRAAAAFPSGTTLVGGVVNGTVPVSYQVTYQGVPNAPSFTLSCNAVDRSFYTSASTKVSDGRMSVFPTDLIIGGSSEEITFSYTTLGSPNWPGYGTIASPLPLVLSSVHFPNRVLTFQWQVYLYQKNTTVPGDWLGYQFDASYDPRYGSGMARNPYWFWGVKEVDDLDTATNVTYKTIHTRVIPQATPYNIPSTAPHTWTSTAFYDAITHPDGSVTVNRFAEPIQGSVGGPFDTLDHQMQTLAHLKHLTTEIRQYTPDQAQYWQSDLGATGAQTHAYQIELFDRWTLLGPVNPTGDFNDSAVPSPTRTRKWDSESRVLHSTELTGWDSVNLGWKTTHRQAMIATNPTLLRPDQSGSPTPCIQSLADVGGNSSYPEASNAAYNTVNKVYSADTTNWFLARVLTDQTIVVQDGTGGAADTSKLPAALPLAQYTYDPSNSGLSRVLQVVASAGSTLVTTTYPYAGSAGSLSSSELSQVAVSGSTDLTGRTGVAAYGYNSLGFLSSIQPLGATWNLQQATDGLGRPQTQTDANHKVTSYAWDGANRLTGITPPDNLVSTGIIYEDNDHLGIKVARGSQQTEYRYNGIGQLVLIRRWDAAATASHKVFQYDMGGRKLFESVWRAGLGLDTEGSSGGSDGDVWTYDGRGRIVSHTDPNGASRGVVTTTAYSGTNVGAARTVTVGNAVTCYQYDALGRLVGVTDAMGFPSSYAYDPGDRIARVLQQDGQTTPGTIRTQTRTWGYHPIGWLQTLVQPESGITVYSGFTVTGKPTVTSYQEDGSTATRTVITTLDTLLRPTAISSSDGSIDQSFQYDDASGAHGAALNQMWYARDNGIERVRTYGEKGGALSRLDTNVWTGGAINTGVQQTFSQTYSLDGYGHRVQSTAGQSTVGISYDLAKDLPISLSWNSGAVVSISAWDAASWNPTQLSYGNGAVTNQAFDQDQARLISLKHFASNSGGTPTAQWSYTYDSHGNLTADGENSYSYDPLNRLAQATVMWSGGSLVESYLFDGFGNLTSKVAVGNLPGSGLTGANLNNFALNAAEMASLSVQNRLPSTARGVATGALYDGQGNLTHIFTQTGQPSTQAGLIYDALGRVVQLSRGLVVEKYAYTSEGLRTLVQIYQGGTLQATKVNLYNDLRQLVSQYAANGSSPGAVSWARDMVYLGTKEIAEFDAIGIHVTHVDHLGSPRLVTKSDGTLESSQKYTPYGETLDLSNPLVAKGFTNHEQTDPSGLIYMQARFYLPMYGRFASPDPARDQHFEETQSWNIYSYVQNSPVMMLDPNGMEGFWAGVVSRTFCKSASVGSR